LSHCPSVSAIGAVAKKISESELEGSAPSLPRKSFALGTDGAVPSSASCYRKTIFGNRYEAFEAVFDLKGLMSDFQKANAGQSAGAA
jgi:hypothetical protein